MCSGGWFLMEPHPSSPIKSEWPEEVKAFWILTVLSTVQARDARHPIPSLGQISEHGRSMSKGGPAGRRAALMLWLFMLTILLSTTSCPTHCFGQVLQLICVSETSFRRGGGTGTLVDQNISIVKFFTLH